MEGLRRAASPALWVPTGTKTSAKIKVTQRLVAVCFAALRMRDRQTSDDVLKDACTRLGAPVLSLQAPKKRIAL
jgi:hypothetical protein